ncbi:MarR family winged helix-turn-helix transcriptional regulator [Subtercola boreus]|uniref:MarR family winged helix-turn-helix transcriptional regulator n=1 Tax=Subtercola boreus TaxID=120213 RepID=UPI00209C58C8|nr:MarR family transcriptional regulator [Subtercola boreus]
MTDSFDFSDLVRPGAGAVAPRTPDDTNVLEALHMYRAAEAAMRRRTGTAMGLGENDLLALRFILDQRSAGHPVASKDITRYLGISSASTTVLIRRLETGGFIERRANSADRRSSELVPTEAAEGDTGPMLAVAQNHMAAATRTLTPEEARIVTRFLTTMRSTVDEIGQK